MIKLRHYDSGDLNALYAISLATGHEGGDASHLYDDGRLIGHVYSPYACLEPAPVLVVVDGDDVVGFAAGATDTSSWEDGLERNWWSVLRGQYPEPDEASRAGWTVDQRRAFAIHHPQRAPRAVVEAYPAHLHLNLLPCAQSRGVGRMLLTAWLQLAAKRGAARIHVGVNCANIRAIRFWSRNGFTDLDPVGRTGGRTVWMGRS